MVEKLIFISDEKGFRFVDIDDTEDTESKKDD